MLLLLVGAALAVEPLVLQVDIAGLRNDDGRVLVAVHTSDATFPGGEPAFAAAATPTGRTATVTFSVPPGRYAVSCLHDEDEDGELDTGIFGIPKEGVGASTDVRRLGPPRFKDSVFDLQAPKTLTIDLTYLL